ncbi:MAG: hypothetical protein KA770_09865, partial [Shewanella sp.]|nr:hypothetical protein [Shewanella sp.]
FKTKIFTVLVRKELAKQAQDKKVVIMVIGHLHLQFATQSVYHKLSNAHKPKHNNQSCLKKYV